MKLSSFEQQLIRGLCRNLFPIGWDPDSTFPVWVNTLGGSDVIGYCAPLNMFFSGSWHMDVNDYWRYYRGAAVYKVIPVGEHGCKLVRMHKADLLAIGSKS